MRRAIGALADFYCWLRARQPLSAVSSVAAALGAVAGILKILGLSSYIYAAIVAALWVVVFLFWIWMVILNPKQIVSGSGIPRRQAIFSGRARAFVGLALPLILSAAFFTIRVTWPRTPHTVEALRRMIQSVDSLRSQMRADGHGVPMSIYRKYRDARVETGGDFFEHVTRALEVRVKDVANHNSQLLVPITASSIRLTSPDLDASSPTGPLAKDVQTVVANFRKADLIRGRIDRLLETRNSQDFRREHDLNEQICAYWERVLCEVGNSTYLTHEDYAAVSRSEGSLRSWLTEKR